VLSRSTVGVLISLRHRSKSKLLIDKLAAVQRLEEAKRVVQVTEKLVVKTRKTVATEGEQEDDEDDDDEDDDEADEDGEEEEVDEEAKQAKQAEIELAHAKHRSHNIAIFLL